ncbi:DHS-like NAD/FAD-binding domain-containing protein [Backusella circina FSU 941]|nr:DHS-like NAD/FAD-binding domain-containing protein [Backusella circina FSU 941]
MSLSKPNGTHHALVQLLEHGYIQNILTQNVDHLHTKAGTPNHHLLELHGTLYKVECMECGDQTADRNHYQHRIHARNPNWANLLGQGKINPDGDVELPDGVSYNDFDIPPCLHCNSIKMKPKVVFFGENIKPAVTQRAEQFVDDCSAILVIGSSLATYSSFRLARLGHQHNKPVGILTKGATRADGLMHWKAEVGCTAVLESVLENLIGPFFKKV